jgi:hypothetical protein
MADNTGSGAAKQQSARSLATAYAEIDKLKENNERLAQELQVLGGFGTLINVLQNGLTEVVGELQPLRDLTSRSSGSPLEEADATRLRVLEDSLQRVASDTYSITITEADVGFLHDTPAAANDGSNTPYQEDGDVQ